MPDLKGIRDKIDRLDIRILELLDSRVELAAAIWKIKSKKGRPVLDPNREAAIIAKLKKLDKRLPDKSVESIFKEIFSAIRATQKKISVAYLGPAGTFTHEAALKIFGAASDYIPLKGWEPVSKEVETGRADYGVLPIENSIEGSVNLTLDLLQESPLNIFGETSLPIHHNLVSRAGSIKSIKKLYSHPQPLSQCRKFLLQALPNVKVEETFSTAAAAEKAAKHGKGSAALSSLVAAHNYELNVLKRSVEDFPNNVTRFVVLSYQLAERTGSDRTSIAVTTSNRPGTLYKLLGFFNERKINLTKIVSRPIPRATWGYLFYIDFEGHRDDKKVSDILKQIARRTDNLKVLGSYPKES
ncbi:MAG: P-protein [bacterium]|nr:MAG: P-protein [bacterium]